MDEHHPRTGVPWVLPVTHAPTDPLLFGHDPTPGIVSVRADLSGLALVWRREDEQVTLERTRSRSWLYARDLADVQHLGSHLATHDDHAPFSARELPGAPGSLRYLLTARDGQALRRAVLAGASQRLGRPITNLHDLSGYYVVGSTEQ